MLNQIEFNFNPRRKYYNYIHKQNLSLADFVNDNMESIHIVGLRFKILTIILFTFVADVERKMNANKT